MRKNPEFEELFDDDFEVRNTFQMNIGQVTTSITTMMMMTIIMMTIIMMMTMKMNTTKVMMKTVTMITPIPMTVPKRKNEEKILKYLWLHLSEKEDVSFPTFPLL